MSGAQVPHTAESRAFASALTDVQKEVRSELVTFGIELEGRFKFHSRPGYPYREPTLESLAEALEKQSGIPIRSNTETDQGGPPEESRWTIHEDNSIMTDHTTEGGMPFEISSRVFSSPAHLEEIANVVNALRELGEVFVDESTGFHVHVGFGVRGFPLRTLQNLAAIVSGYESLLVTLHPPHRQQNVYCNNPSEGFFMDDAAAVACYLPGHQRVAAAINTTSWEELKSLMYGEFTGRGAYNFLPAVSDWKMEHRTVEFRQHAGTLDLLDIFSWIHLTAVFANIGQPGFNVCHLFEFMGFKKLAMHYVNRLHVADDRVPIPQRSAAGQAFLNAAIAFRPEAMKAIEKERQTAGHLMIEEAVLEDGQFWAVDCIGWLPFDQFPYTMSYKEHIAKAEEGDVTATSSKESVNAQDIVEAMVTDQIRDIPLLDWPEQAYCSYEAMMLFDNGLI